MRMPGTIKNVLFASSPFRTWHKDRDQYLLSPTGRWGWPVLSRLVFRIAKNLGMVSYSRHSLDSVKVMRMDIPNKKVLERIADACDPFLERGGDMQDLICIMGPEDFGELASWLSEEYRFHANLCSRFRLASPFELEGQPKNTRAFSYDVPVVVSPYVRGLVVLPRSYFL